MTMHVHVDFETCSEVDLKKVGAYRYMMDASTRVLCMAYLTCDDKVPSMVTRGKWLPGDAWPADFNLKDTIYHAWNANFERLFMARLYMDHDAPIDLSEPRLWRCTMAQAAYWGLPMKLDTAARVLGSAQLKDMDGHKLMLKMSKPMKTKNNVVEWWHEHDPNLLLDLLKYCRQDVEAEREIYKSLPPLPDSEQELWELDQAINDRGVRVDMRLVYTMINLEAQALKKLNAELWAVTGGALSNVNELAKMLTWLKDNKHVNAQVTSLDKDSIREMLDKLGGVTPTGAIVLHIRQEAAKSSVKKIHALARAVSPANQLYGTLQYYGAPRTGRWAGRLFQPQNLPRPKLKAAEVELAIETIKTKPIGHALDFFDVFFGLPPLEVLASCIRGCLISEPSLQFVVADFAQIEARVLAWLAGQQDLLDVFARGDDVYVFTATKIGANDRQLGKVAVLGLGYGMGSQRFIETAEGYGLFLSPTHATQVVETWRKTNPMIPALWKSVERAVRDALHLPGRTERAGMCSFVVSKTHTLFITLPSGRKLVYRNIRIDAHEDEIVYDGVDPYTKKWGEIRSWGGKFVENITQAVARDLMASAMLAIEHNSIAKIKLTVHDELICVSDDPEPALDKVLKIMRRPPSWAKGLPMGAEGWIGDRYRK